MDNDLISREALKKVFNGYHSGKIGPGPKFTLGACLQLIDNAPTVEDRTREVLSLQETIRKLTKERPQGEWIDTGDMQEYWAEEYQCSICGAKDHRHNYCPNCGAQMKGRN